MPKMPDSTREILESGRDLDGPDRSPVPEGYYLLECIGDDEYQGNEFDGVNMKFEIVQPRGFKGKWQWDRFSYNPTASFKWRQLFEATGYEFGSDTAELVEAREKVIAFITQGVAQSGKAKGKLVNNIDEYFEPTDENLTLVDD